MKLFTEFEDVQVREETILLKSPLEQVLEGEDYILKTYNSMKVMQDDDSKVHEIYVSILSYVKEKIKEDSITPKVIEEYLSARENNKKDNEAILRGMYSSVLLEIACAQTEKNIFFRGNGKTWNFLFYHIHHARNITIADFIGESIFEWGGSFGGSIENSTAKNIFGERLYKNVGSWSGSAKHILAEHIKGGGIFVYAGEEKGTAEDIQVIDAEGTSILAYAGRAGNLKNVVAKKIKGDFALSRIGSERGNAEYIVASDLEGNSILASSGSNKGSIKKAVIKNLKGSDGFYGDGFYGNLEAIGGYEGKGEYVTLHNCQGPSILLSAGSSGTLSSVVAHQITSDFFGKYLGKHSYPNTERILLSDIKGNNIFWGVGEQETLVEKIFTTHVSGLYSEQENSPFLDAHLSKLIKVNSKQKKYLNRS